MPGMSTVNPTAYYNENDPHAADWLENLIAAGLIPSGHVDRRSITEVRPEDLEGFTQAHFFAGIGGWPCALRYAGWPDSRPIWTASLPCQPFSAAGRRRGRDDDRHLWPYFHCLVDAARPVVIMGEQVAGKAGRDWFNGIGADLDEGGYFARAVDIPACAVDSPNERNRLYWIAVADNIRHRRGAEVAQRRSEGRTTSGRIDARDVADSLRPGRDATASTGLCGGEESGRTRHGEPERLHGVSTMADRDGIGQQQPQGDQRKGGRRLGNGDERVITMAHGGGIGTEAQPPDAATGRNTIGGGDEGRLVDTNSERCEEQRRAVPDGTELGSPERPAGSYWADAEWIECHDGKARRAKPGLPLLVTGVSGRVAVSRTFEQGEATNEEEIRYVSRVGAWTGIGNAINPVLAAEVIKAYMETDGEPAGITKES